MRRVRQGNHVVMVAVVMADDATESDDLHRGAAGRRPVTSSSCSRWEIGASETAVRIGTVTRSPPGVDGRLRRSGRVRGRARREHLQPVAHAARRTGQIHHERAVGDAGEATREHRRGHLRCAGGTNGVGEAPGSRRREAGACIRGVRSVGESPVPPVVITRSACSKIAVRIAHPPVHRRRRRYVRRR